jgi:hypothetical protein
MLCAVLVQERRMDVARPMLPRQRSNAGRKEDDWLQDIGLTLLEAGKDVSSKQQTVLLAKLAKVNTWPW